MSETTVKSNDFIMPDGRKFGEVKSKKKYKEDLIKGFVFLTSILIIGAFITYSVITTSNMRSSINNKFEVSEVSGGIFEFKAKHYDEEANSVVKLDFKFKDGEAYIVEKGVVTKDLIKSITR